MSFRRFTIACSIAAAALVQVASAAPGAETVAGSQGGQLKEQVGTSTNLSRLNTKKDGLKQFEEELTKSFKPFSADNGLEGVLAPTYQPPPVVIPNRRSKSKSDAKNWMLVNPDAAQSDSLGDDFFKGKSQTGSSQKKTSLEEFYDRLNRQRTATPGAAKNDRLSGNPTLSSADDSEADDDPKLPGALRESAKNLREKLLGAQSGYNLFDSGANRGILSDLVAPERNSFSREQLHDHQDYLQRFKQMLDGPAAMGANTQSPLKPTTPSSGSPLGYTSSDVGGVPRLNTSPTPGTVTTVPNPTAMPDLSANVLNQWNPLYTPPRPEPPKPVTFSSPAMEIPRRRF